LAATVASQPWIGAIDPYVGGVTVVEEAARNLFAVGAVPEALTNCLNFGNPEHPSVMRDFAQTVRGIADGAAGLQLAVPSGNVSFYNGGRGRAIPPTPVLFAVGRVADVGRCTTSDLKEEGNALYLVGRCAPALGGSLYARRRSSFSARAGPPPPVNPEAVRLAGSALLKASANGAVRAVHDVSDGGLAVTLGEMAFGGRLGFSVDLRAVGVAPLARALVAEGASRWVVEVERAATNGFHRALRRIPHARIGEVIEEGAGVLRSGDSELARIDLSALYDRWRRGPAELA
jgi:phosphoribosylformylglycinamidine synthase